MGFNSTSRSSRSSAVQTNLSYMDAHPYALLAPAVDYLKRYTP